VAKAERQGSTSVLTSLKDIVTFSCKLDLRMVIPSGLGGNWAVARLKKPHSAILLVVNNMVMVIEKENGRQVVQEPQFHKFEQEALKGLLGTCLNRSSVESYRYDPLCLTNHIE
jgi:hypothetical protein